MRLPGLRALDRKLLRDLWRMRGQAAAIALVAMCGIATFVALRSGYEALSVSQRSYYEHYRFADVFANFKRAPVTLLDKVRAIPGVNEAQGRVVVDASLDVPGLEEPASGRLLSLPEQEGTGLNRVHLRAGRLPQQGNAREAVVSEAFAAANGLRPGSTLGAVINGRKERLLVTGVGISPEYINEMKGTSFPDNRRFGVLWMDHDGLAGAFDMREAMNDVAVTLAAHASERQVIDRLDALLAPYGSLGAYGREDQLSHSFLSNELAQNRVSSTVIPAIFLGVVAFLTHNVLLRLTALQRAQIALLKGFGYGNAAIGMHYVKFAFVTVLGGALLGIALGTWLGHGLAGLYARFYHFPRLEFGLSAFALAASLLIAAVAALGGAVLATARVLRLRPAEAMRPEAPAHFRPGPLERLGLQRYMGLPLRMVIRNLERNPAKSMLSILGLALAVSLTVTSRFTFDALEEIIRIQFRTAQRDDLTVMLNEHRDIDVVRNLASLPGVTRVEPFRNAPVRLRLAHRAKKTVIVGMAPDGELRRVLDEEERPVRLPDEGIVLSAKLAEVLGAAAGDRLTVEFLDGQRRVTQVPVVRVIDEPLGVLSYMDLDALARLSAEPATASGAYLAVDGARRQALYRELKAIPAVASVTLREATLESFMSTVVENMRINTVVVLTFACAIAFGVVYNSARIALSEHAVELASLRILGFTQAEVARMLLGQQALLTLAALPFGCLLGYALSALLSLLLSQELFRIPLVVSRQTFAFAVGVVLFAAAVSGLLVWRQMRRLDLIAVLKTRE
jgi:putative ABC transport system permease protein